MEAPKVTRPPGIRTYLEPGYRTEYTENFEWDGFYKSQELNKDVLCQPLCGMKPPFVPTDCCISETYAGKEDLTMDHPPPRYPCLTRRNVGQFKSDAYPCVYREVTVQRDDRDRYIDPFGDLITLRDGRRLMYDATHPDMMYASKWSSELADPPGPLSYPTTIGLEPHIPWSKDLQWQVESEVGKWPTDKWNCWTKRAACPSYCGHDDQTVYAKHKMPNTPP